MEFLLQIYSDEKRWAALSEEESDRAHSAFMAYNQALREAGVHVGGNRLESTATATVVHVSADGKTSVHDGPYAETKEQLGGYYLIDVADLDAAIAWAARCPGASYGKIEVRPIAPVPARV